jgi:peroxiredoxin Q/BCP
MQTVTVGSKVTNFSVPSTAGNFNLQEHAGKYLVLYFYPRDNTPGCTQEGKDFRDLYSKFQQLNTDIFGISRDSIESHNKFKTSQEFPFELLADTNGDICELFDVLDLKNSTDKSTCSMTRTTFVIDPTGILLGDWRTVKVAGHAAEVLNFINDKVNA